MTASIQPHPVLVVDDEPQMIQLVRIALRAQGFQTLAASSALEAWHCLRENRVCVVVLDVMMPGESGVDLCRRLREFSEVPIILLTALGREEERIAGLEAGADDYLVKPFSPRELALRVAVLARRGGGTAQPLSSGPVHTVGSLRLEAGVQQAMVSGRPVHMSSSEFRMLWLMSEHVGETVSWHDLHAALGENADAVGERELVRTAIYRLRARLGDNLSAPRFILTDRGRGYRLVADC